MYRPARLAALFGVLSILTGVVFFTVAQSRGVGGGGGVGVPGLRNPVEEIVFDDATTQTTACVGSGADPVDARPVTNNIDLNGYTLFSESTNDLSLTAGNPFVPGGIGPTLYFYGTNSDDFPLLEGLSIMYLPDRNGPSQTTDHYFAITDADDLGNGIRFFPDRRVVDGMGIWSMTNFGTLQADTGRFAASTIYAGTSEVTQSKINSWDDTAAAGTPTLDDVAVQGNTLTSTNLVLGDPTNRTKTTFSSQLRDLYDAWRTPMYNFARSDDVLGLGDAFNPVLALQYNKNFASEYNIPICAWQARNSVGADGTSIVWAIVNLDDADGSLTEVIYNPVGRRSGSAYIPRLSSLFYGGAGPGEGLTDYNGWNIEDGDWDRCSFMSSWAFYINPEWKWTVQDGPGQWVNDFRQAPRFYQGMGYSHFSSNVVIWGGTNWSESSGVLTMDNQPVVEGLSVYNSVWVYSNLYVTNGTAYFAGGTILLGTNVVSSNQVIEWNEAADEVPGLTSQVAAIEAKGNLSDYTNDVGYATSNAIPDLTAISNNLAAVSNAVDAFTNVANVVMYFGEDVDNGVFQAAPGGGAPTAYQVISNWTAVGINDNFTANTNGYVVVDTTGRYWVFFSGGVQCNDGDMEWSIFVNGSESVLSTIRETAGNDAGSVSCGGYLDLTAGQTVDVRVAWFDRTDRDLYMVKGQLSMGLQQSIAGGSITETQIAAWNATTNGFIDACECPEWQSTNTAQWICLFTNVSTAPFDGWAYPTFTGLENGAYGQTPPGHEMAWRFTTNGSEIVDSGGSNTFFIVGNQSIHRDTKYECTEGTVYTNCYELYPDDLGGIGTRTSRVYNAKFNIIYAKELP